MFQTEKFCSHTEEFYNSLEWSIVKVCLFGNKLTVRVVVHCPLHVLEAGTKSSSKEGCADFSSAVMAHETTPKVSWCFKGYWLKEFPQQTSDICYELTNH